MLNLDKLALNVLTLFSFMLTSMSTANARDLVIFSSDAPPHMIAANNSGIDIDIVNTILTEMGHTTRIEFLPLKRAMEQVKNAEADVFLPTFYQKDSDKLYISTPYIQYRPMIFSLKSKALLVNNFSAFKGLRILSFQGASGYFGEEFRQATKTASYTELHDMSKFPEMLLMQRFDLVVLDYYIFYYFLKMHQEQSELANNELFPLVDNYSSLIKRHDLIPQVNAYVGFNNEELRNQFNRKLAQFIKSRRHDKVIEKYIGTISSRIFVLNSTAIPVS